MYKKKKLFWKKLFWKKLMLAGTLFFTNVPGCVLVMPTSESHLLTAQMALRGTPVLYFLDKENWKYLQGNETVFQSTKQSNSKGLVDAR